MEAYIVFIIVYTLVTGLSTIGFTMTGFLPRTKEEYTPASPLYYYITGSIGVIIALVGALVL